MNRFSTALETKEISEGTTSYTLKGYASVFGNKDLDDDVIEKGAFAASLKSRQPQFLWGHDMGSIPLGTIKTIHEDATGLYFEAELPRDDELVKGRIAPQLRAGSIKGVSIGFRIQEREHRKDGVRVIKTAELFEISLVNIPANPLAGVTGFKGLGVSPFHADLPLADRKRRWTEADAIERIKAHCGVASEVTPEYREAFLYADPAGDSSDPSSYKFCIADVIDGRLTAVPAAIYKCYAALTKSRGSELSSEVREALQLTLDRYYARIDPATTTKCFSLSEWEHLEAGEREARLRALGLSGGLAKTLASGPRDADRTPRDVGVLDEEVRKALTAIQQLAKGLPANGC